MAALAFIGHKLAGDFLAARQLPHSPLELRTLHRSILGQICPNVKRENECGSISGVRQGRLRVGAAIGATGDYLERAQALVAKKVDVLAIDTAHGHTSRVMAAIKNIRCKLPQVQLTAGNVATYEGARELASLGVDGIKVGIGPGLICTTRVVSGAGVPQITAISECAPAAKRASR
jgi:hypothetical protein